MTSRSDSHDRRPYLDGLRGVAALMVFMIHSGAPLLRAQGRLGNLLVDYGKYGVSVFFVVSAFTLCMTMAPALDAQQVSWTRYFIRRFFRIAPLYYLVLAFVILSNSTVRAREDFWPTILAHFTFANMALPHYANDLLQVEWSIAVEFAFYLILPLLLVLCRSRRGIAALACATAMLTYNYNSIAQLFGEPYMSFRQLNLLGHGVPFVVGMMCFLALRRHGVEGVVKHLLVVIGALAVLVLFCSSEGRWSEPLISLGTAAVLVSAATRGIAGRVLSRWPLAQIGKISYSVYLTHCFCLHYLHPFREPNLNVLLALACTLALSSVTYLAVEQPMRRLGGLVARRIGRDRNGEGEPSPNLPAVAQRAA